MENHGYHQASMKIPSTVLSPLSRCGTLVRTAHPQFPTSGAIIYGPWSISGYYQNHSVMKEKHGTLGKKGKREVAQGF